MKEQTATSPLPERVTGVHLMQGIGQRETRGFWTDAWLQVLRRPSAVFGIAWIAVVALFAALAPVIASGHPLLMWEISPEGTTRGPTSPLIRYLSSVDVLLLLGLVAGPLWLLIPMRLARSTRGWVLLLAGLQAGLTVIVSGAISAYFMRRDAPDWARSLEQQSWFVPLAASIVACLSALPFVFVTPMRTVLGRLAIVAVVALAAGGTAAWKWQPQLERFDYREREAAGDIRAVYTLIPFSPTQGDTTLFLKSPGTTLADVQQQDNIRGKFVLGTDGVGQDVLSQLLHACRLSISIGLVSTSIAVVIGVTIGALMGYFGGWVDLLLYRVVEVFMAIPLLFLLIVAAAVLPRNTYVMMAIIGCVTWTGAARFIRAEFYKLRNQDFVQSARAVGLPLRSILFKHMLPNGVTPVLVEASFAIAVAILIEAILSFLGLGPAGQPSWGKLLSDATSEVGAFVPWLAIYPGAAIFLTVLSYNLIGEALRDAIDPKLKKARV